MRLISNCFLAICILGAGIVNAVEVNLPKQNQYLSAAILSITHIDMGQTDSYPYSLPKGTYLDWDSGEIVHRTIFGQTNYGNGDHALLEIYPDNNLIFNSIGGPFRIQYPHH